MRILPVLLLFGLPAAMAQQPVEVTACDIVLNIDKFDGKLVAIKSKVVRGPHDVYLVARDCRPDQDAATCPWMTTATPTEPSTCLEFIALAYDDPKTPGLKKFNKLFFKRAKVKHCSDCFKYDISARLIGVIKKAQPGGFGFISAKVALNIVDVSDMQATKAKPPS